MTLIEMLQQSAPDATPQAAPGAIDAWIDQQEAQDAAPALQPFQKAVALSLERRKLGIRRKVNAGAVEAKAQDGSERKTDPDMLHVSKQILDSPEFEAIASLDREIGQFIETRANPAGLLKTGIYLIPIARLQEIDAAIARYQTDRAALVDAFMAAYETAKTQAAAKLGPLYNPQDYPPADDVRARFGVSVQYLEFGPPRALAAIDRAMFQRAQAEAEAQWSAALEDGRRLLYGELAELTGKLIERLTPGADGKKKVFRDSLVTNVSEWLDTIRDRNLTNDPELLQLADQAREALRGKSADSLRNRWTAADVRAKFEQIKTTIDTAEVLTAPSRKYADD